MCLSVTIPEFNREQATQVHDLFEERIRSLNPADFSQMMRSAMRGDEWLLLIHGAVLGVLRSQLPVSLLTRHF